MSSLNCFNAHCKSIGNMKTNFKLNYSVWLMNQISTIALILLCLNTAFSQDVGDDFVNLNIVNISFPDTVYIGDIITLNTYVKNTGDVTISKDISVYFDIGDNEFQDYDYENDYSEGIQNITLIPGDSVLISKQIEISLSKFVSNSTNIIVIWPEVANLREVPSPKTYNVIETYVVGAFVEDLYQDIEDLDITVEDDGLDGIDNGLDEILDNEIEEIAVESGLDEDLDNEIDEVIDNGFDEDLDNEINDVIDNGFDEDLDNEVNENIGGGFDEDLDDKEGNNLYNNGDIKHNNKIAHKILNKNFNFTRSNQSIIIHKISDEIEFLGASIFSIDGKILSTTNMNSNFPIIVEHNSQPLILKLKVSYQKNPENVFIINKLF